MLLFDMDGTLTDSQEGIVKSVSYALERLCRERGHFFCTEHGFYVPF